MAVLVSAETVLLVLLLVLVVGLLRSQAELLRRIGPARDDLLPASDRPPELAVRPPLAGDAKPGDGGGHPAPAISGATLSGDPVVLDLGGVSAAPVLLAFLTSGCTTCRQFWEALGEDDLPGVQTVIVAKGSDRDRPSRLRELAPPAVPVIVSSMAWEDYRVPGSPYFVLVDRTVRGEGVASTWTALRSLVADALADAGTAADLSTVPLRARRVDEVLAASGIRPGDPSLYPTDAPARTPSSRGGRVSELALIGLLSATLGAVAAAWSP